MAMNKKMQFCFNKMALYPTSVMGYMMPLKSDFLISGLEESQTKTMAPMKPRPHTNGLFLW
jgi:hypothetical protein